MGDVLAIVVAYEHPDVLEKCVDSLYYQTYKDLDIVIWDNSAVASRAPLSDTNIVYHHDGDNIYWTPALNAAMRNFRNENHKYVLTLNHDMYLPRDCVSNLVKAFEELPDHAGAVSPTSYGIGGLQGTASLRDSNRVRANYLIGACAMYKTEVFDRIGLFDEDMPLSGDDFDFSLRMREADFSLWVDETDHATHVCHITGDSKDWDTKGAESWEAFNIKYTNYFKDEDEARAALWDDARYNSEFPIGTGITDEEKIARGIKCLPQS